MKEADSFPRKSRRLAACTLDTERGDGTSCVSCSTGTRFSRDGTTFADGDVSSVCNFCQDNYYVVGTTCTACPGSQFVTYETSDTADTNGVKGAASCALIPGSQQLWNFLNVGASNSPPTGTGIPAWPTDINAGTSICDWNWETNSKGVICDTGKKKITEVNLPSLSLDVDIDTYKLGELAELLTLDLSSNSLTGIIAKTADHLPASLTTLKLGGNAFTGIGSHAQTLAALTVPAQFTMDDNEVFCDKAVFSDTLTGDADTPTEIIGAKCIATDLTGYNAETWVTIPGTGLGVTVTLPKYGKAGVEAVVVVTTISGVYDFAPITGKDWDTVQETDRTADTEFKLVTLAAADTQAPVTIPFIANSAVYVHVKVRVATEIDALSAVAIEKTVTPQTTNAAVLSEVTAVPTSNNGHSIDVKVATSDAKTVAGHVQVIVTLNTVATIEAFRTKFAEAEAVGFAKNQGTAVIATSGTASAITVVDNQNLKANTLYNVYVCALGAESALRATTVTTNAAQLGTTMTVAATAGLGHSISVTLPSSDSIGDNQVGSAIVVVSRTTLSNAAEVDAARLVADAPGRISIDVVLAVATSQTLVVITDNANLEANTLYNVYVVARGASRLAPVTGTVTTNAAQLTGDLVAVPTPAGTLAVGHSVTVTVPASDSIGTQANGDGQAVIVVTEGTLNAAQIKAATDQTNTMTANIALVVGATQAQEVIVSAANLQSNTQYNVYVVANGNNALAPLSTTVTTHAAQLSDQAVVAVDGHSIQLTTKTDSWRDEASVRVMVTKDTGDPDTTAQLNTWWDEYVAVADNLRTTAEGHVAVVAQGVWDLTQANSLLTDLTFPVTEPYTMYSNTQYRVYLIPQGSTESVLWNGLVTTSAPKLSSVALLTPTADTGYGVDFSPHRSDSEGHATVVVCKGSCTISNAAQFNAIVANPASDTNYVQQGTVKYGPGEAGCGYAGDAMTCSATKMDTDTGGGVTNTASTSDVQYRASEEWFPSINEVMRCNTAYTIYMLPVGTNGVVSSKSVTTNACQLIDISVAADPTAAEIHVTVTSDSVGSEALNDAVVLVLSAGEQITDLFNFDEEIARLASGAGATADHMAGGAGVVKGLISFTAAATPTTIALTTGLAAATEYSVYVASAVRAPLATRQLSAQMRITTFVAAVEVAVGSNFIIVQATEATERPKVLGVSGHSVHMTAAEFNALYAASDDLGVKVCSGSMATSVSDTAKQELQCAGLASNSQVSLYVMSSGIVQGPLSAKTDAPEIGRASCRERV